MGIETLMLGLIGVGITLYAIFGGADFGAGVWEFNTALRSSPAEQRLIERAIGPVWEANHVWLIFVIVAMFSAFPAAFAGLSRALWLPLLLALMGIVFRGAGFAFRSYTPASEHEYAVWRGLFALASTATPFFFGGAVGAVASGRLPIAADGSFSGDYLFGWVSGLAIFDGFFAVGMCAYLASVFLTREAAALNDAVLIDLWRRRALAVGVVMGALSLAGLAFVAHDAPQLWAGFRARGAPLVIASLAAGFLSLWAVWTRHHRLANAGASLTVATVVWGWAVAQYPFVVPPAIRVDSGPAPTAVLQLMAWSTAAGMLIVVPAIVWLMSLFKSQAALKEK
jgi:cytochrome d ubiquinol oxidase subunit II